MVKKNIIESIKSTDAKSRRWKSLFSAARMAYEAGELRQAASLLARARELANELPEHNFAVQSTEIAIAALHIAENKQRDAASRLQRCILRLGSESDFELKELYAVALRFHAQTLEETGDDNEAEKELKKSIAVLEDLGVNAAVQLAYSICDLASLFLKQGRLSEAEKYMNNGLEILFNALGPDSAEYTRADMIFTTCRIAESDSRMEYIVDGIEKMEFMFGKNHPNILRAFDRYVKALRDKGDSHRLEKAMDRLKLKTKSMRFKTPF